MTRVVLRIDFANDHHLGHGRIELLELIAENGSISKAAKAMGMSYKRAWYLAESINQTFAQPVVARRHGGAGGGAAELTAFGQDVVRCYRAMEAHVLKACAQEIRTLERKLATAPPAAR